MSDMEDKISAVLNNPQMMQQIMNMAQSLGAASPPPPAPEPKQTTPNIDLGMLQKFAGVASEAKTDQNQQALLRALSPYLSKDRIGRLEKAMRAAKMAKLAGSLLGSGLLSPTGR